MAVLGQGEDAPKAASLGLGTQGEDAPKAVSLGLGAKRAWDDVGLQ